MIRLLALATAAAFAFAGAAVPTGSPQDPSVPPSPSNNQVTVTRVVQEVDAALAMVGSGIAAQKLQLPPLKSATVTLQTTVSKQAGGKFTFLVFSFGTKWTKEQSQTLEVVLAPPAARPVAPTTIAADLASAVLAAAAGVAQASSPLTIRSVDVQVSFVVKSDTNAGGKFSIVPIDIDFSGDLTRNAVHKVGLVFAGSGSK